jgi:hypothetical protein
MTATLWLRLAAVIQLLFTVGHSLGGRKQWSPMGDHGVLRQMTSVRFDTMGANRSYLEFFLGFGWSLAVFMLLQAILLWQLASVASTNPAATRPMIVVFAAASVATAVIAWRFLFPLPALFSLAVTACLVIAWLLARPGVAAAT